MAALSPACSSTTATPVTEMPGTVASPVFCKGATSIPYGPFGQPAAIFPDDAFTVADPTSVTGLRLHAVVGEDLKLVPIEEAFQSSFADLGTLDGWGTTAPLVIRVSGPLAASSLPTDPAATTTPGSSVVLMDMDATPPALVPIQVETVDESASDPTPTLVLSPMVSLQPKHHYGAAVTTRVLASDGTCVAPSATMQQLLTGGGGTERHLERVRDREATFLAALKTAGVVKGVDELAAAVVFTTQHTFEDSVSIAKTIRTTKPVYVSSGPCVTEALYRHCEGTFQAFDFRVDQRAIDDATLAPQSPYTLKVSSWLPLTGTGPFPTVVFGHGLGSTRAQAAGLAGPAAPYGIATVAIDAVGHGDHPDGNQGVAGFFGLSATSADAFDGLALREHFRQSTYDRLQLIEMLRPGVDLDGDGQPDVSLARFGYAGASLGAIGSGELLSLLPEANIAVAVLPGARITNVMRHSPLLGAYINVTGLNSGQLVRFLSLAQTLIDRGDPGAYAQHIVRDRFPGFDAAYPEMLVQFAMNDQIVPNQENFFFARVLDLPLVGDELGAIGVPHEQALPTTANVDAKHTGGVFEFDVIEQSDGTLVPAGHTTLPTNVVAVKQWAGFMNTHLVGPAATIIDPYRTLGLKP